MDPRTLRALAIGAAMIGFTCLLITLAEAATAPAEPVAGLIEQLRPLIVDVAVVIITGLATMAVARFQAWTGIQIEARHREALQSALANAARIAVEQGMDQGVLYVQRSVPDALAAFGAQSIARVRELLAPHVARVRAGGPA